MKNIIGLLIVCFLITGCGMNFIKGDPITYQNDSVECSSETYKTFGDVGTVERNIYFIECMEKKGYKETSGIKQDYIKSIKESERIRKQ